MPKLDPKVLIIDNEIEIAEIISDMIGSGYQKTIISDSQKAPDAMASNSFDLIITDLVMPVFSGIDIINYAKQSNLDAKIVVSTGYDISNNEVKKALEAGADSIITKPFDDLKGMIDNLMLQN